MLFRSLRCGVTPGALVTRRSVENVIDDVMATSGTTNAVLHLLAMARGFGVALAIDDLDVISSRTPWPDGSATSLLAESPLSSTCCSGKLCF